MRLGAYQTNVQRIHVLGKDQTYHKEWLKLVVKNERKEEEEYIVTAGKMQEIDRGKNNLDILTSW